MTTPRGIISAITSQFMHSRSESVSPRHHIHHHHHQHVLQQQQTTQSNNATASNVNSNSGIFTSTDLTSSTSSASSASPTTPKTPKEGSSLSSSTGSSSSPTLSTSSTTTGTATSNPAPTSLPLQLSSVTSLSSPATERLATDRLATDRSQAPISVHLIDGPTMVLKVPKSFSTLEALTLITQMVGLTNYGSFWLFEQTPDKKRVSARMLEKNEKVVEIHPHSQLVFKRLLFLDEEAEKKEFEHMVARKLAYKQARHSLVQGQFVVNFDSMQLAQLAALNCIADEISLSESTLSKLLPPDQLKVKKGKEWVPLIQSCLQSLHGIKKEDAQLEYLTQVRKCRFYGYTFFSPVRVTAPSLNGSLKAVISVSLKGGISFLNPKNKMLLQSFEIRDIHSWASSSGTFAFEPGDIDGDEKKKSNRYLFETKEGPDIAGLLMLYAEYLCQDLEAQFNAGKLPPDFFSTPSSAAKKT